MEEINVMDIIINYAKPEDAEGVFNVRKATWLDTYPNKELEISVEDIESAFTNPEEQIKNYAEFYTEMNKDLTASKVIVWTAKFDSKIIGFVSVKKILQ